MNIAFFHGLESLSITDKSEYLYRKFPNAYAPTIDYHNPTAFDEVLKQVKDRKIDLLAGSSMGGWFAYCISTLTGIPTVLFNPAVQGRSFEPAVKIGSKPAAHQIVLGKRDNIINPIKTIEWFKTNGIGTPKFNWESNDHRTPLDIFQKYISMNEKFVMKFESFLQRINNT